MASLPGRTFNLLVLHSDPLVRAGLDAALRQQPGFSVFGHPTDHGHPEAPVFDVLITDYWNALELTKESSRRSAGVPPGVKLLVVTSNDRETDIRRAIEAGVYGYCLVGGPLEELVDGVTAVAHGLRFMSPAAAHRMADSLTRASLTSREIEILQLVAAGQANKTIARQLSIELGTVKSHVSALLMKLGACSRTEAARIAAARGLVEERIRSEPVRMHITRRVQQSQPQFA